MPQLPAKAASSSVTAMPPSLMSCPAEILSSAMRLWVVLYMAFRLLTSTSGVSLPSWLYTCNSWSRIVSCYFVREQLHFVRKQLHFVLDKISCKPVLPATEHTLACRLRRHSPSVLDICCQAAQAVHRFVQESLGVREHQTGSSCTAVYDAFTLRYT